MNTPVSPEPHRLHLSASQRKILALEQQCEVLRQSAIEFNHFLNYVITNHPTETVNGTNQFTVLKKKLTNMEAKTVRSELSRTDLGEEVLVFRQVESDEPQRKIILPGE